MDQIIQLAVSSILAFITNLPAIVKDAAYVAQVIGWLETLIPLVIKGAPDLYQPIKNLIADVRGNPATSKADLDTLDAYEAALDAKTDTAAQAALAEDAATDGN